MIPPYVDPEVAQNVALFAVFLSIGLFAAYAGLRWLRRRRRI